MKQKLFPYYLSIALALVLILGGAFQLRSSNISLAEFSHPALAFFGLYSDEPEEDEEDSEEDEEEDDNEEGDGEEGDGEEEDGDEGDGSEDGDNGTDDDEGDSDDDADNDDDDEGNIDDGDNEYYYCNRCSSTTSAGNTTYHCSVEKFANSCSDNCQSDADCGGGGDEPEPPSKPKPPEDNEDGDEEDNVGDGQHKECVGVMYGYTSYCRVMDGESSDQCGCHEDCRAANPPDEKHTECVGDACVLVPGGGINQCTYYTDCLNDSKVNNFVGFVVNNTQQIYTTVTTAIQDAWIGFINFLF